MQLVIPEHVTHYHLSDKAPFLNLSELSESELSPVMADLDQRRRAAGLKRLFGRKYMDLRRLTEARLRALFLEAGGKPERQVPHYFCLGDCEWFHRVAPEMRAVVVPLSALPDEVTSFTYPDSVAAMGYGAKFGLPYSPQPYHNRAFRLAELPEVVRAYGLPSGSADMDYDGYHLRPFEKYIEVQVWSDRPLVPWR